MQAVRKCHILSSLFLLLISSGQCMDSKEVRQKERRILLDHVLQVNGDSQRGDKPSVSSRYNSDLFPTAQHMKFSSGEKPLYVPRLDNSKPIDNVPRDINLKDKFIKHFTGPVKFSSECRTHFHRLYHNTRDCSRPACLTLSKLMTTDRKQTFIKGICLDYKRCARLLTRLAMSPLCSQS